MSTQASVYQRFHPRLQQALVQRLGWRSLRPVQELAAQALLDGDDALILAPTAGGKTEAAVFPVVSQLLTEPVPSAGVRLLYIAPLRALLNNQEERLARYAEMVGFKAFKWHGESLPRDKQAFLREPAELLLITPESLEVMLISPNVPTAQLFATLSHVIVDEIHALAGCERGSHLLALLERLQVLAPRPLQRIGLSATVGNVQALLAWLQGASPRPGRVVQPAQPATPKRLEIRLLDEGGVGPLIGARALGRKSLIFTDSRRQAESVGRALVAQDVQAYVHHASVSRQARADAEAQLAAGRNIAVVCTSTLELGIDLGELDRVFQIEAPSSVAAFLQRLGRTGRRPGSEANTTFLVTRDESLLQAIALLELARTGWVEDVALEDRAWPILVQQLMALCLQTGGISRHQAWQVLSRARCFAGIAPSDYRALVDFALAQDLLSEESGLLSLGLNAEKTFGRQHFAELYAVFSSPVAYTVQSVQGQPLGVLEGLFADALNVGSAFLLSGRSWSVAQVNHTLKTVAVVPAGGAQISRAPQWGGFAPVLLSHRLCRQMREVLISDSEYPYCDAEALKRLLELRRERYFLAKGPAVLQAEGRQLRWWTYAGARINQTLRYALEQRLGWEISANNYSLQWLGDAGDEALLLRELAQLGQPENWRVPGFWEALLDALPPGRLSKFQGCLPPEQARELQAQTYLDLPGAQAFARQISGA
ncbi:MAG: DEAD/DEAH box helicase [Candidatus Sericytochromatia bacterium]